jgi:hypothetical protein
MNSPRFTASASRASDEKDSKALLRCGISICRRRTEPKSRKASLALGPQSDLPLRNRHANHANSGVR